MIEERRNEGWYGEPIIIKCGTCSVEFDILRAKDCKHNKDGIGTKECPNGHCVCHKPINKFRWANKEEQDLGFAFVLKSAFPLK